jgi:hypothetical protein
MECKGYQPIKQEMIPAPQLGGYFDPMSEQSSYCINCHCPAHAHQIVHETLRFPKELIYTFLNHKFAQIDFNFNVLVVIFFLKQEAPEEISKLHSIFNDYGYEVYNCFHVTYTNLLLLGSWV